MALFLSSCEDDKSLSLLEGFEIVSKDKNSFFVLVTEDYWGDRYTQRQEGYKICNFYKILDDYCEVLFFSNPNDIPTKFPIVNRKSGMGQFKMSYGKNQNRVLPKPEPEQQQLVFVMIKDFYLKYLSKLEAKKASVTR